MSIDQKGQTTGDQENINGNKNVTEKGGKGKRLELREDYISTSYDLLNEREQTLWRTLGVFPNNFDPLAAAALWEIENETTLDVLGKLLSASMIEWDENPGRYRLHNSAREYANAQMSEEERNGACKRHARHYIAVLRETKKLYKDGNETTLRGLSLFDLEWNNICAGQAWAELHSADDDETARLCCDYPIAGLYCLDLRQHPRERIRWMKSALSAAQLLKDPKMESAHLGNIGLAYANLSEMRHAIEYFEQHLKLAREISDRQGQGKALGNLGNAYADLGEPRHAIKYYEQNMKIVREIDDRRGEGKTLCNLGITYKDLGEPRRAIEYFEQALEIDRDIGNRRGEGTTLGNLGIAYANLSETRRAIEYYDRHLKITREIGDRHGEGKALGNLGNAYAALDEPRRAIEYYEQSLNIKREIGDRRGEGNALFNMSLVQHKLDDPDTAIASAQAALTIYEQIEDPNAAKVRQQLKTWREEKASEDS